MPISVEQGDICTATTDAVVNPANEQLRNGAGVAGALNRATQGIWQHACDLHVQKFGPLFPCGGSGHIWTAPPGLVPFKHIISVAGPRWGGFGARGPDEAVPTMRQVMRLVLNLCVANGFESVSVPAISSGLFGVPVDLVAKALFEAAEWFPELDIRFRNYDSPTVEVFRAEAARRNVGVER